MGFFRLCFFIGLFLFSRTIFAQDTFTEEKSTTPQKPRIKSSIKFKNADTLQIDTVVIVYKKKDTSLALKKYKGKILPITTSLGGYVSTTVPAKTMQQLLDSALDFADEKGNNYKVLNYRFCYKKKDVFIEDETMVVKTRYDLFCLQLQETPMPLKYKKQIQTDVLSQEQFWFENIVVENTKGEKFLARDISLLTD